MPWVQDFDNLLFRQGVVVKIQLKISRKQQPNASQYNEKETIPINNPVQHNICLRQEGV